MPENDPISSLFSKKVIMQATSKFSKGIKRVEWSKARMKKKAPANMKRGVGGDRIKDYAVDAT